ncbi:MAG: hypothetical protein LBJ12_06680 [Oscillospiraceae bacterium]|jgi:hypothetical protein|nr:hypothetical protein [Oscillospiraceae bacterium]
MAKTDAEKLAEIRQKQSQLKAKEQAIMQRQKQAERKADTRRKIILGGIWLKFFPDCKNFDPSDEENFAGVANAIAVLANDGQFLDLWMRVQEAGGIAPTGSVES